MAGKYGSSSVTVKYDDAGGGTLRTITSYILTLGGVKFTSQMVESTAMGDTLKKMLPTGVGEIAQIELEGFWDTTATSGPHAVFASPDTDPNGSTRTLEIVFGDSKQWSSEGFLVSYEVLAQAGTLTRFKAVLQQNSGAWS